MIALLLACRAPEPSAPPETHNEPPAGGQTADTGAPRPVLTSPPEAPDLDPAEDVVRVALTAAPHTFEVDGVAIDGWAYEGSVPGPTIRAELGQTVIVEFTNALPSPTTVHWHGARVPAEMDGAGWPMPEIAPGGTFTYTFTAERAGTFWYHPHLDTHHQVDRGLYGVFVIEDPAEPEADEELVVVLDAFGEPGAAEADPHVVDATLSTWALNGLVDPVYTVPGGSVVRVRLVNASNAGYVALPGQRTIARDQGILAAAEDGEVILAPGDRAELEWRVGAGGDVLRRPFAVAGGAALGDPVRLMTVAADPPADEPQGLAWPFSGEEPSADPGTTDVRFLMTGTPELGWELNGETFPDVTVPALDLGQDVVLEVRNASPSHHPFHVHGHAFEVLSVDGVAPAHRAVEDTVDVPIYGIVRLGMTADNPGEWMTHCHVLPHAEGGMMTLLEVR